jgi:site-specific DNA-methyltransferase (adenine-specific)
MDIKQTSTQEIRPYGKNAKNHPQAQIDQIANSIRAFGFNQPIVVDTDGVIIVGHGRYFAAQKLGLDTVPVLTLELGEEEAKAYRLADNKLNESDWDMELVIEELKGLSAELLDLTGFDKDLILEDDDRDDVIPAHATDPRTKLGDVYELNGHRLVCGDSTVPLVYEILMQGAQADMVFTDPPYNVNYKGQGENTKRTIENDHMTPEAFDIFLKGFFTTAVAVVKQGGGWYIFHSSSTQNQFEQALKLAGLEVRAQLIWNKPMSALGWGDYRWKHEPLFYAGKAETELQFYGDRTHSTVLDFQATDKELLAWAQKQKRLEAQGRTTIWSMKRDPVRTYIHPTQKPVELITYALVNSSKAGDVILDPFGGSGSTLIASEKAARFARLIELDPTFCDDIVQRFVDYTDGECKVIKNGKPEVWAVSEGHEPTMEETDREDSEITEDELDGIETEDVELEKNEV